MIKFSGAYNSTIDFYVCIQIFSSVQSSTAFQRFPRLTAQLFADTRNGKTRISTDPRKFSVSCTVCLHCPMWSLFANSVTKLLYNIIASCPDKLVITLLIDHITLSTLTPIWAEGFSLHTRHGKVNRNC